MSPLPRRLLAAFAALLGAASAGAHNAPGSAVFLDFFRDHVRAELRLPLSELELSFRQPLLAASYSPNAHPTGAPAASSTPAEIRARVERHRSALTSYLLAHVVPRAPDGRPWRVTATDLGVAFGEGPVDLVVHLRLAPPFGAPLRRFTLNYDAIVHEVINHIAFVAVRRDWNHAIFADQIEPLTPIRFFHKSLAVDRTGGSVWLGLRHHLLVAFDRTPPLVLVGICAGLTLALGLAFSRRARGLARRGVALIALPFSTRLAPADRVDGCR